MHDNSPRGIPYRLSIREALHFVWSLPASTLVTEPDNVEQLQEKIALARSFDRMEAAGRTALAEKMLT